MVGATRGTTGVSASAVERSGLYVEAGCVLDRLAGRRRLPGARLP
jgi:hypothetical protein